MFEKKTQKFLEILMYTPPTHDVGQICLGPKAEQWSKDTDRSTAYYT